MPAEAYHAGAETPTKYWWDHPDVMWLQTFWFMVADLRASSFYLFFVLHKRMRSPLTGTIPRMSPGMPTLLKKNDNNNPNHKRNHKPTHNLN